MCLLFIILSIFTLTIDMDVEFIVCLSLYNDWGDTCAYICERTCESTIYTITFELYLLHLFIGLFELLITN